MIALFIFAALVYLSFGLGVMVSVYSHDDAPWSKALCVVSVPLLWPLAFAFGAGYRSRRP